MGGCQRAGVRVRGLGLLPRPRGPRPRGPDTPDALDRIDLAGPTYFYVKSLPRRSKALPGGRATERLGDPQDYSGPCS